VFNPSVGVFFSGFLPSAEHSQLVDGLMRALDPEVVNDVWATVRVLIPERVDIHPLGCHYSAYTGIVSVLEGILIRLVTGCWGTTAEKLLGGAVSDICFAVAFVTNGSRPECSTRLATEAVEVYNQSVGLDHTDRVDRRQPTQDTIRWGRNRPEPMRGGQSPVVKLVPGL